MYLLHTLIFGIVCLFAVVGCDSSKSEAKAADTGESSKPIQSDAGLAKAVRASPDAGSKVKYDLEDWVTHSDEEGRWSAQFPGGPGTQPTTLVYLSKGTDAMETIWTDDDNSEVFAVRWHKFSKPIPPEPKTLVRVVEGFVAEMGLQQATRRPTAVGVLPAVDLIARTRTGHVMVARMFASSESLIQIFAVSRDTRAAEHFVATLEYRVPQGGPVTYKLDKCDLNIALPAEPTLESMKFEVAGIDIDAAHYITNVIESRVGLGVICYPLLPDVQMNASPRELVEGPLDALQSATQGASPNTKTDREGAKFYSIRSFDIPAGEGSGRILARSEVMGDHVVVRYISTPTKKEPDDRVIEFFLPRDERAVNSTD